MSLGRRTLGRILGADAHPGGSRLTRHLFAALGLTPGAEVVDVACGSGATLRLLRRARCAGLGVDVEVGAVRAASRHGLALVADAHRLPLRSAAYDAAICECALSTMHDPRAAIAEMARVLRPGGGLAVSDVTADRHGIDAATLTVLDGLTTARPLHWYAETIREADLDVVLVEDRPAEALTAVRRIRRLLAPAAAVTPTANAWHDAARRVEDAVLAGAAGYGVVVARKRTATSATSASGRPNEGPDRPW